MATLAPLHLYLLAHPKSESANKLATILMRRFVEPPASGGLRIPVFFTPDRGDDLPPELNILEAAQHTLVVVLADARMLQTVPTGTGDAWIDFVQRAIAMAPLDDSAHHILPVALEPEGFQLSGSQHVLPATLSEEGDPAEALERQIAEISFHIGARAIQLLDQGKVAASAPEVMKAPVTIFLSHAKADLDRKSHDDPVRHTREFLNELPVDQWWDAQKIAPGQDFADAIVAGIRDSSIMLAFQTDHYSSRPWCRREVLAAKQRGVHILVIDAIQTGEPRSFPYVGNVPTIRWSFAKDHRVDAQRVIDRAVLEALRFKHNRAVLQLLAAPEETVLSAAPEALTLANEYGEVDQPKLFLYPDPPLGREELKVLHDLRPKASFITPLTKLAREAGSARPATITVSISASDDVRRYGLSAEHFDTLSDEIHLYLLLAGLKIAYGGALKGSFSGASNFTLRLFELVRAYSKLADGLDVTPLKKAIINVAPWPLYLDYGQPEWKLFNGTDALAEYRPAPRPDLAAGEDDLFPPQDDKTKSRVFGVEDTPLRRVAWAKGLTAMRKAITEESQARLVIGGALNKFAGLVPGVVEETWMSLQAAHPVFIVGGFGGAARAVTDRLMGIDRPEFSDDWIRQKVPAYESAIALYEKHGGQLRSLKQIGADIVLLGKNGLAKTLNNGLSEEENRELVTCTDPQRIAGLVLTGISKLGKRPG
jgi:hypothetical protein